MAPLNSDNAITYLSSMTIYSSKSKTAVQSSEDLYEEHLQRLGLVAGIVIGGLACLIILAIIVALLSMRRRRRRTMNEKGDLPKLELEGLDGSAEAERRSEMEARSDRAAQVSAS